MPLVTEVALSDLFSAVEGPEVALRAALSNNIAALRYAVFGIPVVQQAIGVIRGDTRLADAVVERVRALLCTGSEPDQMHRYDAAIATYLLVLGETNLDGVRRAMDSVHEAALRNLFWTYAVAGSLGGRSPDSSTESVSGLEWGALPSDASPDKWSARTEGASSVS
jgi:hypothetical protein